MDEPIYDKVVPLSTYLVLDEMYPCIPEGSILWPYAAALDIGSAAPAVLADVVQPATRAALLPELCRGNAVIAGVLKRNQTLKSAAVFKEFAPSKPPHGATGTPQSHSEAAAAVWGQGAPGRGKGTGRIRTAIRVSGPPTLPADDNYLLVGHESGAVALWNLSKYDLFIADQRRAAVAYALASAARAKASGLSADCSPGVCVPPSALITPLHKCVELLGYHDGGPVECSAYCKESSLSVTGGVDGTLCLWDTHGTLFHRNALHKGQMGNMASEFPERDGAVAGQMSADAQDDIGVFTTLARTRRLCSSRRQAHDAPVTAAVACKGYIITGGADGFTRVWRVDVDSAGGRAALNLMQSVSVGGQWVVGLQATDTTNVQPDNVIATDDTGGMMALRFTRAHGMHTAGARAGKAASVRLSDQGPFHVSRQRQIPSASSTSHRDQRLTLEVGGVRTAVETASRAAVLKPIANDTLILSLSCTADIALLDYTTLCVVGVIAHPSANMDEAMLAHKAAMNICRQEVVRQADVVGWRLSGPSKPGRSARATAAAAAHASGGSRTNSGDDRDPLRFVDALEVPSLACVLFLDNRDTLFLWDLPTRAFVAKMDLASLDASAAPGSFASHGIGLKPRALLAFEGRARVDACDTAPDSNGGRSPSISFLVVCEGGVVRLRTAPTPNALLEAAVHKDVVVGICPCFRGAGAAPSWEVPPHSDPPAAEFTLPSVLVSHLGGRYHEVKEASDAAAVSLLDSSRAAMRDAAEMAARDSVISFVSASADGLLVCFGGHLQVVHMYNLSSYFADGHLAAPPSRHSRPGTRSASRHPSRGAVVCASHSAAGDGADNPTDRRQFSEVTCFFYHPTWNLAVTGHDDGTVCFWGCEGVLTDLVHRETRHGNSVTAITAAVNVGDEPNAGLLVSVGFDGRAATWRHPTEPSRRAPNRREKRISYNEILSLCACPINVGCSAGACGALVAGDSAGNLFFLDAATLVVLRLASASSDPATAQFLPGGRRTGPAESDQRGLCLSRHGSPRGSSTSGHNAAVVMVCAMSESVVSCDEDGCLFRWTDARKDSRATLTPSRLVCTSEPPSAFTSPHSAMAPDQPPSSSAIAAIVHVSGEMFLVCADRGIVYTFNCAINRLESIAEYRHSVEVTSLACFHEDGLSAMAPSPLNPSPELSQLSVVIGAANGTVTKLQLSAMFSSTHIGA